MIRLAALLIWLASAAIAQDTRATLTAAEADGGRWSDEITLTLSQPVPWRVFIAPDPWRLVVDTAEVDWTGLDPNALSDIGTPRTGRLRAGWTRLVLPLETEARIQRAWMETGDTATIHIEIEKGTPPDLPPPADWSAMPDVVPTVPRPRQSGDRPLVVALDPGHGGIDPGAERGSTTEAALMLRFARELSDILRADGHSVVLTRDADQFVGLRGRPSIARAAGADLMISLHADAVAGGGAQGATVYTLSDEATDDLTAEIAQRQARDDLLLGVDRAPEGDEIAEVLIDLARLETAPRSNALANALVYSMARAGITLHKRPRLGANFTVLKAPDIPTVLLELGFMSDDTDLTNILSAEWRARMAQAVANGVSAWAVEDAAEAERLRQ